MFCPNCQTQNPEGVGFCGRCGTPLAAPAAPAQSAYQPPVNAQPAPVSPAVAAVKKVCASPLTLIAAITFTLSWLMGLITILAEPYALVAMAFEAFTELDMPITSILEMLVRIEDYLIPGYLILSIPTLFIIFGLWVAYTGNLSRQNPAGRTGGLGLIKAGVIIQMVVALAGLAFGSFLAIGGGITVASSRYTQEMAPVWIAIGVVLLLTLVFALIFFIGALKSLTAARVTLKTGQVVKKASAFVAVMCFLSALSSLSPLAMLGEDMEITILLSTLCSVVSSLMFGVLIFIYRGKTAPYRVAFAQPVYAQPMYQQPAYQQPAYQPAYQQPVYQQAAQPAYQPVATPAYQPAPQPVAVAAPPVYQPAPAPVEPVVEVEPVAEPVVEVAPVVEPIVEPVAEAAPVVEPIVEPVAEAAPVVEPVAEEPVVEVAPVVEPIVEPVAEAAPVVEPVVEEPVVETAPVAEPVLAPAEEPVAPPVAEPAPAPQPVAAPARVFCTQCGQPLTTDQRFCPNCGKPNQ